MCRIYSLDKGHVSRVFSRGKRSTVFVCPIECARESAHFKATDTNKSETEPPPTQRPSSASHTSVYEGVQCYCFPAAELWLPCPHPAYCRYSICPRIIYAAQHRSGSTRTVLDCNLHVRGDVNSGQRAAIKLLRGYLST